MPLFHDFANIEETEVGVETNSENRVTTEGASNFDRRIGEFKNKVINDYTKYNVDLNKTIANIAKNSHLNNEQIKRIVEEVNTELYLIEYNKKRTTSVRDVDFEIASLPKVKDLLGPKDVANKDTAVDPETQNEDHTMDKSASAKETIDAFTYSPNYESVDLSIKSRYTENDIKKKRMNEKISAETKDGYSHLSKVANLSETMADGLIKYANLNEDYQQIFEDVCHDANMLKRTQLLIKEAFTKNVNHLKEMSKIAKEFPDELKFVNVDDEDYNKYSLGKHSLNKRASEEIPNVVVNKQAIKGYKNLVEIANKIMEEEQKYRESQVSLDGYKEELQELEK